MLYKLQSNLRKGELHRVPGLGPKLLERGVIQGLILCRSILGGTKGDTRSIEYGSYGDYKGVTFTFSLLNASKTRHINKLAHVGCKVMFSQLSFVPCSQVCRALFFLQLN